MLATYRLYEGCWSAFTATYRLLWLHGTVWWQPTGLLTAVGPLLRLYVGNLQAV